MIKLQEGILETLYSQHASENEWPETYNWHLKCDNPVGLNSLAYGILFNLQLNSVRI